MFVQRLLIYVRVGVWLWRVAKESPRQCCCLLQCVGPGIRVVQSLSYENIFAGQVFLWLGDECSNKEATRGNKVAQDYVKVKKVNGQHTAFPFTRVKQGQEPPAFTANFHGWDSSPAKKV